MAKRKRCRRRRFYPSWCECGHCQGYSVFHGYYAVHIEVVNSEPWVED